MRNTTEIDISNRKEAASDEMDLIPAGEFIMGSPDADPRDYEHPLHNVYTDAFCMDVHTVTNASYKAFVDANPHWEKDRIYQGYAEGYLRHWHDNNYPEGEAEHPVIFVSWHAAMAYAKWLGKRLPTEAEWEKAARGGLEGKKFSWGDTLPDGTQCNFADKNTNYKWSNMDVDDGFKHTAPVGSYPANGYGLFDMTGNVWEWCLDAYHYHFTNSPRRNPIGGAERIADVVDNHREIRTERVYRGGSLEEDERFLRIEFRSNYPPWNTEHNLGFRCVKDISA